MDTADSSNVKKEFVSNPIVNGYFKAEALNVQGYDIVSVGKRNAQSVKFKEKTDLDFDPAILVDAISSKGDVYAFKKKGIVKALYAVRKDETSYRCSEIIYAPDIDGNSITGLMDQQVAFLMAQKASYLKIKALFRDTEMPPLKQNSNGYNWSMGVCFALIYAMLFSNGFSSISGMMIGASIGICMGFCFTEYTYHYEGYEDAPVFRGTAENGEDIDSYSREEDFEDAEPDEIGEE